jgi:two-component system response regulator DesR
VIRVAVVQEVPLFRGALADLLHREVDLEVVAEGATWSEVADVVQSAGADVVIIDLEGPDADVVGSVDAVFKTAPTTRVLMLLTALPSALLLRTDLHMLGFVTCRASPDHLLSAVRSLAAGDSVLDPDLVAAALELPENPLTAREQDVLSLVAQGTPTNEIARRLALSAGTVRNCLSRINTKTGARNRIEAVDRARQAGWL